MEPTLGALFGLSALAACFGLGLVLSVRSRERARVGDVLEAVLPGRRARAWSGLALAVPFAWMAAEEPVVGATLALLGILLVAVHFLRPGADDRVCGDRGVRHGWSVRGFDELEEWRLIGDHLRFRLHGEWTAVDLASERQAPVLERLRAVAGDRESAFNQ